MSNFNNEPMEDYIYNLQNHALIINEHKETLKSIPTKLYATLLDNHIEFVNKYRKIIEDHGEYTNEMNHLIIN